TPLGTMLATAAGMAIYVAVVIKLAFSASPEQLAGDQLIMTRIALWGPIIPIGLACATFSSALGSILVAPRTLQALGGDRILPSARLNELLARGVGAAKEPRNAAAVTAILSLTTVAMGNVDFVARIISMFFMLTYGALCAISALEHFAARPDYRPTFRSRWYVSLIGAVACLILMLQMDPLYAILAILAMLLLYRLIRTARSDEQDDLGVIFHGVMTQLTRYLQVRLQKSASSGSAADAEWRPSIIMVDGRTFDRAAPIQLLTWLCHRYAVGTYLHYIPGALEPATFQQSRTVLEDLIELVQDRRSSLFVDTMISPSMRSALAQSLQVPGISGVDNNTALFEFSIHDPPEVLEEIEDGCRLAWITRMDTLVLRHGEQFFGARRRIHLWLTWNDYRNANLMILLAYMLLGHPDWDDAEVGVFAAFPAADVEENTIKLRTMAREGRIPVSPHNLVIIPTDDRVDFEQLVEDRSLRADLVVLGYT
ncbi:MAG: amino acid permease, partial [Alphaproteobacteria bacterium]